MLEASRGQSCDKFSHNDVYMPYAHLITLFSYHIPHHTLLIKYIHTIWCRVANKKPSFNHTCSHRLPHTSDKPHKALSPNTHSPVSSRHKTTQIASNDSNGNSKIHYYKKNNNGKITPMPPTTPRENGHKPSTMMTSIKKKTLVASLKQNYKNYKRNSPNWKDNSWWTDPMVSRRN